MDHTTAVYVILPSAKMLLSSVKRASPNKESMQKYTTIASAAAMNIQPRYTLRLKPPLRWPFLYSSGTASRVDADRSFSNTPMKMTGSEVKSVLNMLSDHDSYSEVPV